VQVKGSRILLTGATGGIGGATAAVLAARGADLIVTGRREDVLRPLADRLGARAIVCDLADRRQLEQLVSDAGDVDGLVANAALPGAGLLADLGQSEIDRMLEVNLRAPVALAKALAPGMVERGRGQLVFVSSLNGRVATPATSIYAATKFGLRGFALGLRQDLRPHGVGVSLVLPGFVREAGMFADAGVKLPPGVRTVSPQQVGRGVVRAIERDRAEVDVAPFDLRLGARFGSVAPELAARVNRLVGADRIAADLADRQRGRL
jgi:short-subunit dehydrogenase